MFEITADMDTPVSVFLKLKPLRPYYLLENIEGAGTRQGRYSFIGFGPAKETVLRRPEVADETLRGAIKAAARFGVEDAPFETYPHPHFAGGIVGYTAYDYVDGHGGPRGQLPIGAYVSTSAVLVFDHVRRMMTLLVHGDQAEARAFRDEVMAALRHPVEAIEAMEVAEPIAQVSEQQFYERAQAALKRIDNGDVQQLVLSIPFTGEATGGHPFAAYRALRALNPAPYLYFLDIGGVQVVGSSPQALIRVQDHKVFLKPIAGTRPRGTTEAEDRRLEKELLNDPKEVREHEMLVQAARHAIAGVTQPHSIVVRPSRVVERHSHVMHIVSGVEGQLAEECDAVDAFRASFPAGTTVGSPKRVAREILAELESEPREIYAGTVGFFGHNNNLEQAIAIRTMWFHDGRFRYQAGAGIVRGSDIPLEYAECFAKGRAIREALRQAPHFANAAVCRPF